MELSENQQRMTDGNLSINLFDGIVLGVVGLSCVISFFRGFLREFLSLASWVGAGLITVYKFKAVAEFLKPHLKDDKVTFAAAGLGTYFFSLLILSLIGSVLVRYLKEGSEVGAFDNFLGLIFGFLKGSLIVVLGFFLFTLVVGEDEYPEWMKDAVTLPTVKEATAVASDMMPKYLQDLTAYTKKAREGTLKPDDKLPWQQETPPAAPGYEPKDVDEFQKFLDDTMRGMERPRESDAAPAEESPPGFDLAPQPAHP